MYAVLDIEATGGKKGEEDIIEVAIYRFDGKNVTDQLISLVQPERKIDPYVQKLTQITPKMVRTAPKFHELAKRVIEITENAILVGHNVDFDYRMLKQEFKKLGYTYYRETIDTVPLSEKFFPEATSYSLGKLSKELGIPVSDRHRASGDARATIELFKLLLEKDALKEISKSVVDTRKTKSKFSSFYEDLPNQEGLYYFLDGSGSVIYLTHTQNIVQSVRKILTGKSALSNQIRMNFESVRHEVSGNDLISRIKVINELKKLKPKLNNRKSEYNFCIALKESQDYKKLVIQKIRKTNQNPVLRFGNYRTAYQLLTLITEEFELCPKLNELSAKENGCLSYSVGECHGACEGKESAEKYNQRVQNFLKKISLQNRNFLLTAEGRSRGEHSFVWVKDGQCKGYGYYEFHHQIKTEKRIKERMTELEPSNTVNSIVEGFLLTEKYSELILLNS